jgi:hypothetical protein
MVTIIYKNGKSITFELKNREREMDFCIDVSEAHRKGKLVKYKITNTRGIVVFINTSEIKTCRYAGGKTKAEQLVNDLINVMGGK